jgi:hypothetical protein
MKRVLLPLIAALLLLCSLAFFFSALHGLPRFYTQFLWQSCLLFGSFGVIAGFACGYLSRAVDRPTIDTHEDHGGEVLGWSHNLKAKEEPAPKRAESVDALLLTMRRRSAALEKMKSSRP